MHFISACLCRIDISSRVARRYFGTMIDTAAQIFPGPTNMQPDRSPASIVFPNMPTIRFPLGRLNVHRKLNQRKKKRMVEMYEGSKLIRDGLGLKSDGPKKVALPYLPMHRNIGKQASQGRELDTDGLKSNALQ